jgi:outer membrane biosynthesis protein TonB
MNAAIAMAGHWTRSLALPWEHASAQEERFRRIRAIVLVAVMLFALLMWVLPSFEAPKPAPLEVPQPVRVLLPPKPAPPKPPPPPEVVKPTAPAVRPVPTQPRVTEAPAPVNNTKSGSAPPGPTARERAAAAMSNAFADLSSLKDPSQVSKAVTGDPTMTGRPDPNKNSLLNGGAGTGPGSERNMITAKAGQGSGGVNNGPASAGYGGGGLAGRGTTLVAGYGGGGYGTGKGTAAGYGGGGHGTGTGEGNGTGSGSGGSRSREEIDLMFDQNKGALMAIYLRALRDNPTLQGDVVFELTIEPSGAVSDCHLVSSDLHDPELEAKLVQRVRSFHFSAKDVARVTAKKPYQFFPTGD